MSAPWGHGPTQFFYALTPDVIDQVLRDHGLRPAGRVLALNSLENRVYEVEVARFTPPEGPFGDTSVVVKFYRPGRWDGPTLREEHSFLAEMASYELPVIAPLERDGETLFRHPGTDLLYTVFPKARGRLKDELSSEEAAQIGRMIARLHNIGAMGKFRHRPTLDAHAWLQGNASAVTSLPFLPEDLRASYLHLVGLLEGMIAPWLKQLPLQRIHGDFHRGNILWTSEGPWITDLDDCVMGPRQQDLWLLFPGRDEWSREMRELFLEGYHAMAREPLTLSFALIEALRSLRMVHFNGWIAKRWEDPTFPHTFQAFPTRSYWEQQVLDLKEQVGHLTEAGTGFGG